MEYLSINKLERNVTINFKTSFYNLNAIMESAQAYSDSCWTYVDGNADDLVIVVLTPKDDSIDLKELGLDFYTYVLSVMQNQS